MMKAEQTEEQQAGMTLVWRSASQLSFSRIRRQALRLVTVWLALQLVGGSMITAAEAEQRALVMTTAGWGFNLLRWEGDALWNKIEAQRTRPAAGLSAEEGARAVLDYMARVEQIYPLESEIVRLASESDGELPSDVQGLQDELDALRSQQASSRPLVEQVIEGQVGHYIQQEGVEFAGWPFPPVQFTFIDPPKKLVVSPRDRIVTSFTRMLDFAFGVPQAEATEDKIRREFDLSAYATEIGGLGAYPTMVIDRANLRWILSTVAHEWTHNYLTLFPLGLHYFASPDMTTINETVAEIVGNELGAKTYEGYYAPVVPPPPPAPSLAPTDAPQFDFVEEMRTTRLEVDRLLAEGKVEEAEDYMAARRQVFAENGYPLRVLNQAYFAFHGSYGTSPASTSPIGPKLNRLRELTPDLQTFLRTVRWFTSAADLDRALAEWEARNTDLSAVSQRTLRK
jgi:hypothetical protein